METFDSPHVLTLRDGRQLEVRVSGPTEGLPFIFHHGTPGAATASRQLEDAIHARGMRFVTFSRPGYGQSSRHPGRRVVDVAADTAHVMEWLAAPQCVVAGMSGGGPHALACGARLAGVRAVLVISGVAPYGVEGLDWFEGMGSDNVDEFGAALRGEATLRDYLTPYEEVLRDMEAGQIVASMASLLPEVDRAVLTDEYGDNVAASFRHAVAHGIDGWLDDDLAFAQPWGFALDEITTATFIWQGDADLMVPFAHGQWLARQLPHARAHLEPGEGHLSIEVRRLDEMLDEVVAALATTEPPLI